MTTSDHTHGLMTNATVRRCLLPLVVAGTALTGCEFLDPTDVTNPTVTEGTFLETPNAAASWTRGVERQLAATIDEIIVGTEVVSDNVFNNRTLFSKVFDIPQIDAPDFDVLNIQSEIHELRASADQGLNLVVPADPSATDEIRAQLHFYRGFGHLLSAELFVSLPGEPGGAPLSPSEHVTRAVADFQEARSLSADPQLDAASLLATARAHYVVGNQSAAVSAAEQVIGEAPSLVRYVQYDNVDGPGNTMQFAIYDSGQDEFQPLPRLDFLFPKYFSETAADESPIALLKIEEAHLILAEADLAQGNLAAARAELLALVGLVGTRPVAQIDDRGQERGRQGGTWIYPNSSDVAVAASPGAEPREGLVLDRSEGLVEVPILSGTSVTEAMLNDATTEEELLYLLYLMRQEIFVVEGRRMTDLGIRFPVALDEALTNPNVDEGSTALQARIPPFIPGNFGLDSFDYEDGDELAVIDNDMNRVLVENRSSDAVLPFH